MRKRRFFFIIYLALSSLTTTLQADEPVYEVIETIKSKFDPRGDMASCGDGYFYGAARWTSNSPGGAIFRIAPHQPMEILHSFPSQTGWPVPNTGGSNPSTTLILGPDGAFYGATTGGGAHGWGVIYRITSEGTFSVVYDIKDTDNYTDVIQLVSGPGGYLYGFFYFGGVHDSGRLFRVSLDGTFEVLHDFSAFSVETEPKLRRPLCLCTGADGNLYGVCNGGGRLFNTHHGPVWSATLYRYDAAGQFTILTDFGEMDQIIRSLHAAPDGFYVTTDQYLFHVTLTGEKTELANFQADGKGDSVQPRAGVVTPEGFYGITFYGGENNSGFVYRHLRGQGVEYLYDMAFEHRWYGRSLVLGNDGLVYGVAAAPENFPSASVSLSASTLQMQSSAASDKKTNRAPQPKAGQSFRFRDPAISAHNFVPLVRNETVMLPQKASGSSRQVTVPVLNNDRDPDRDPLSLAGIGGAGLGSLQIVQTKGRQSLRFSTDEVDPPSRKIEYHVADDMGGESTGTLHLLSPAKGTYVGTAASAGQLTVSIGAGNMCNATFAEAGRRYTGKGALDSSDAANIRLKAKGAAHAGLHLELERGASRVLKATLTANGELLEVDCRSK